MKDYNAYSKSAYNQKADHYDTSPEGAFTRKYKEMLSEIMTLKNHTNVLDVACGNGRLLGMLSEKCHINGYGIDISDKMIGNAKKNYSDMVFKIAGCENIPFKNDYFETMTVCAAYHHFPDTDAFAKEAARVMKSNGKIYIAEIYLPTVLRILCNPFLRFSKEGDYKFYAPKKIASHFEKYGFLCSNIVVKGKIQIVCMQKID